MDDFIRRQQVLNEIGRLQEAFKGEGDIMNGVLLVLSALEGVVRALPSAGKEQ